MLKTKSNPWAMLRRRARALRKSARRAGMRGDHRASIGFGFRAAQMEADACKLEAEYRAAHPANETKGGRPRKARQVDALEQEMALWQ